MRFYECISGSDDPCLGLSLPRTACCEPAPDVVYDLCRRLDALLGSHPCSPPCPHIFQDAIHLTDLKDHDQSTTKPKKSVEHIHDAAHPQILPPPDPNHRVECHSRCARCRTQTRTAGDWRQNAHIFLRPRDHIGGDGDALGVGAPFCRCRNDGAVGEAQIVAFTCPHTSTVFRRPRHPSSCQAEP